MTRQEKTRAPLLGYVGCRDQLFVFSGDIEESLKQIGVSIWESRDSGLHSMTVFWGLYPGALFWNSPTWVLHVPQKGVVIKGITGRS